MPGPQQQQQELFWRGSEGSAYTARNPHELHPGRVRFFQEHVAALSPNSILEIGCNTGDNLRALGLEGAGGAHSRPPAPVAARALLARPARCAVQALLADQASLAGREAPQRPAKVAGSGRGDPPGQRRLLGLDLEHASLRQLHAACPHIPLTCGSIFNLPFADGSFDLVMTVAVLIHMSPANLPRALDEIHRASRRYILTHEYFAEAETDIPWHGRRGVLFKRNFLACWLQRYPDLRLIDTGYRGPDDGFDRMTYWILEKKRKSVPQSATALLQHPVFCIMPREH